MERMAWAPQMHPGFYKEACGILTGFSGPEKEDVGVTPVLENLPELQLTCYVTLEGLLPLSEPKTFIICEMGTIQP